MKDHDTNRCRLFLAFAMAVIASFPILAEEWDVTESGNVRAALTNGVLTISGNGRMVGYEPQGMPSSESPWSGEVVTQAVIKTGVKNVGKYSFWQCEYLRDVIFENGVESIEEYAFALCQKLSKVNLNGSSCMSVGLA